MSEENQDLKPSKELKDKKAPDQKVLNIAKDASIDFPVLVVATEADPYHETGAKFHAGSKKAAELVKRGWVKMAMIALLISASFAINAQTSVLSSLYSSYGATVLIDTVTDTGTAYLTTVKVSQPGQVTIQVNVTKISGTVGGTISLQGSLDGTNFKALNTQETQTALATITATDASNVYHWRLSASPFLYYRVSWVGTGTMSASFTAKILKH